MVRFSAFLLVLFAMTIVSRGGERLDLVWPTPNPAYAKGEPSEEYAQPTISGRIESAFFGCVRNGGTRFHEGVDLKPIARDRRGEAIDPVFAVMNGVVLHTNRIAGNSSYGRYIVLEHPETIPSVITLYAHMASIDDAVEPGITVRRGQTIGIMGRSAGGYVIPRERAHVHFEIGFWISENFQAWYDWRGFGSQNNHRHLNGMNLIGIDPIDFYDQYRVGHATCFQSYLEQLSVAYTVRVKSDRVPDFVRRYPSLVQGSVPVEGPGGWEIDFTSYGLPKGWRALFSGDPGLKAQRGRVELIGHDAEVAALHACRNTLRTERGRLTIGSHTERMLQLLFGFR